ncbi:MAG: tetratricopeptide repeat protein [Elainellaceae cyanobacterium]
MKSFINLLWPRSAAAQAANAYEQLARAMALQTEGAAFYKNGQYDAAVPCLETALALWTILGDFHAEQRLFEWLATCYSHLGQSQAAQYCDQEALALAQRI